MVDAFKLPEEIVVALKTHGAPPNPIDESQNFTPKEMGVRSLARLQIPTQMGMATETCKVLHDLIDQITQLRRMNLRQDWQYGLRLQNLISVANARLRLYTKSSV